MKRLLRITSHTGLSRYLSTVNDNVGWITRTNIPSPYASGPTHLVYHDPKRGRVIIVETAHKRYDVFTVADTPVYASDDLATEAYMANLTSVAR